jgi:hypothetical protein
VRRRSNRPYECPRDRSSTITSFSARNASSIENERTDLHVAHGDAIVTAIPHDLIFDLLPPLHALLHEHLRARRKRLAAQRLELRLILRKARAEPAKRICGAHDDRVPNFRGGQMASSIVVADRALRALFSYLLHRCREELSVLRRDDSLDRACRALARRAPQTRP